MARSCGHGEARTARDGRHGGGECLPPRIPVRRPQLSTPFPRLHPLAPLPSQLITAAPQRHFASSLILSLVLNPPADTELCGA